MAERLISAAKARFGADAKIRLLKEGVLVRGYIGWAYAEFSLDIRSPLSKPLTVKGAVYSVKGLSAKANLCLLFLSREPEAFKKVWKPMLRSLRFAS